MGSQVSKETKPALSDRYAHAARPPDVETDSAFDVAYAKSVQEAAQPHMQTAVDTLVELATGERPGEDGKNEKVDTTPATRRGAANDIISHGHTRSSGKQADMERALAGGINITVIQQSGEPVKVIAESVEAPTMDVDPVEDAEVVEE